MLEVVEHLFGLASFAAVGSDDNWAVVLFGFICGAGCRSTFSFQLIGDLDVTEAKFCQTVLEQPFFLDGQIAFGLFLQYSEQVDGMAGESEIRFWFFAAFLDFTQVKETKLHLRLHQDGLEQEEKTGRRDRDIAGFCHTNHNVIAIVGSRYIGGGPFRGSRGEV